MIEILDQAITRRPSHRHIDMDWHLVCELNNNHFVVMLLTGDNIYVIGLYNAQKGIIDKPRYAYFEKAAKKIYYAEVAYWATQFEFK